MKADLLDGETIVEYLRYRGWAIRREKWRHPDFDQAAETPDQAFDFQADRDEVNRQ